MRPAQIFKQGVLLLFVVGPLLATVYAMVSLWNHMIGWRELTLFLALYFLTGVGVTFGYHRMLTHHSFETGPVVKVVVLILAAMAVQGRAIDWAANHLKHHAFSDKEGDPHSPLEGFFHAHVGWIFSAPPADRERYCKRLLSDRLIVAIDRTFLLWVGLGLLIPYLIAGWQGLLWGGFVRIVVVNHVTWAVNSICHTFGDRPFDIKDQSRNNWLIGLLAFGEGWHHNHHAFPAMAYHGMTWRQFDLTALIIRLMLRLRLVWNVKTPSAELVERRRRKPLVAAMAANGD
ncbi:MAG TPA: acyl-CoA desaturase [Nitrolancea sp.]|jgi:stearoyl-CoA desaturase (delta-9 desaturase)|nr:acyl-CoA desaturase [Nitrolancea sp.]